MNDHEDNTPSNDEIQHNITLNKFKESIMKFVYENNSGLDIFSKIDIAYISCIGTIIEDYDKNELFDQDEFCETITMYYKAYQEIVEKYIKTFC